VRYLIRVLLFTCCAAFLAACGGDGSGSKEGVDPITAPYTGTYVFDTLLVTSVDGNMDSEDCDPFKAEFSYSPERSVGKVQCGINESESLYYYIDTTDSSAWVSCEEVDFTITGTYTAEITYSCTDYLNDVYQAVGSVTKTGNSFTVLSEDKYWEDPDNL